MKDRHSMLLGAVAILVLPASPASANVELDARQAAEFAPQPSLRQFNFTLSHRQPVLEPRSVTRPAFISWRSYRAVAGIAPATDLWARLPNPTMSYQAGRRGPVIQLGAFSGALAYLSVDWDF